LLLRAEKKPDSSIELKTNAASKPRDAGFPRNARTREACEGMRLYPKKIDHADWHQRGRSLERKRRKALRRSYPTRWLRIWKGTKRSSVQSCSHCNQNARIPDARSPIRGLIRLTLNPKI